MTSNLQALWKGLAGVSDGAGWQTLGIRPQAHCSISAAIRHPEVLEAVMLDVMASSIPSNLDLPEAQGFRVLLERRSPGAKGQVLLILERTQSGGSELFAQMVDDVLDITEAASSEEAAVRAFVGRIVAWKRFMHEMRPTGLSDSEEIGLLGELVVLQLMSLPMSKFFNVNENPMTMDLDFSKTSMIMDKMDGSLMTTYLLENQLYLKSKTALASDQAIAAMELFNHDEHAALYNYLTYMEHAGYSVSLEFTSPKFRIVLGYQDSNLTVLCARDKSNGEYVSYEQLYEDMVEFGCEKYLVKNHIKDIPSNKILEFIDNIPNMTGI